MLMTLSNLIERFDLGISGVVHVGAHLGEEAPAYAEAGIETVWWIEGNPDIIPKLSGIVGPYGHRVICALVTDRDEHPTTFHVTNMESMSSSVFEFGTHPQFSPEVRFVDHKVLSSRRLDTICAEHGIGPECNFLNMDIQGAELLALTGAPTLLDQIDYISTEVNVDEVYRGCARLSQLDDFLAAIGFRRVATEMARYTNYGDAGWGDALYVRGRRS